MQEICCRWSPTLGRLSGTHQEMWGTKDYDPTTDSEKPCVFFGIYGLPDFYALWRHKGKKWVLWAGTDIIHFQNGYWLDGKGKIRICHEGLAQWINQYCENWTENEVEAGALKKVGIETKVCPSFLGDINKFEVSYKHSENPKVYASVSGKNYVMYGWPKIYKLAEEYPGIEFHLYGNETKQSRKNHINIFIHGRMPQEQMNEEIKEMQGGLRMLEFDGFSEIVGKSLMWGQWPISLINYPHVLSVEEIGTLKDRKDPNIEGRDYYREKLNSYPWNLKK